MTSDPVPHDQIIRDPVALRALAHPLRLKLVELVGREGKITGADAAEQLGISQALASHHLRQLAKYGFIEPAESDDRRSRPWRVTATSMHPRPEGPEGRAATDVLHLQLLQRTVQQLQDWQDRRGEYDERWSAESEISNGLVYLTVDELEELRAAIAAVVGPLIQRRRIGDHSARPSDAVPVAYTFVATPIPPTDQGG